MTAPPIPELPKPTGTRLGKRGVFGIGMIDCEVDSNEFTADQMRAFYLQGVEAGVKQERERAATAAEGFVANAQDWDSSYWDQCAQQIANAIRKG
jgi:hypothetical protein